MFECKFCNSQRKNKNSLINHERLCKDNLDRKPSFLMVSENRTQIKALNQFTKARELGKEVPVVKETTRQKLSQTAKKRLFSEETRKKLSDLAKKNNLGGHTSKNKIYYKTVDGNVVYLQSSYEVKLAIILDENNIKWSRPASLKWIDELGKDHRYYPDFEINGIYIDTKNEYLIIKDAEKIKRVREQNKIILHILSESDINIDKILSLLSIKSDAAVL